MVTKMLASLLFKVGLEHVACLWQKKKKKKVLLILYLKSYLTHLVTHRAGKPHA